MWGYVDDKEQTFVLSYRILRWYAKRKMELGKLKEGKTERRRGNGGLMAE